MFFIKIYLRLSYRRLICKANDKSAILDGQSHNYVYQQTMFGPVPYLLCDEKLNL